MTPETTGTKQTSGGKPGDGTDIRPRETAGPKPKPPVPQTTGRRFRAHDGWQKLRTFNIVRRLQNEFRLGKTIRSAYGVRLTCNFQDFTFRCYVNAAYGYFLWDHISAIDHPFVFVDIGANQGLYSLCAARNAQSRHIYAFEPSDRIFDLLQRNIHLNGAADKCTPLKFAIAAQTGQAHMRVKPGHSGGASLAESNPVAKEGLEIQRVATLNHAGLEQAIADSDLPVVVKVDVEGFEPVVLSELLKSGFAKRISQIFYEVDEHWVDPAHLTDLLTAHGFTKFEKQGRRKHYDILATR